MRFDSSPRRYSAVRARWHKVRATVRGAAAVLGCLATAADHLATAVLGIGPLSPRVRRLGQVLAAEYRAGYLGAITIRTDEEAR
ncbi:hypothetical protein [Actinomadura rugatobispora]|uniref:Uncharacterized protein n=1 Tax=Actinomadura rugatobispora TaxID=1994 RepID=A0ABW0ZNK5_9ACTN|nr:hypothetical protein GCM10010200_036770 [Actinomadura rugatobispora]